MDETTTFAPAHELADLVANKQVSPVELTALYLERIERLDSKLNAYLTGTGEPPASGVSDTIDTPPPTATPSVRRRQRAVENYSNDKSDNGNNPVATVPSNPNWLQLTAPERRHAERHICATHRHARP